MSKFSNQCGNSGIPQHGLWRRPTDADIWLAMLRLVLLIVVPRQQQAGDRGPECPRNDIDCHDVKTLMLQLDINIVVADL